MAASSGGNAAVEHDSSGMIKLDDRRSALTHIGGPTALIEVGGWRLLTDPTFDPPGRSYHFGWGTSSRKLAGPGGRGGRARRRSTPSCSATTTTTTTSTPPAARCCRRPARSSPRSAGARRLGGERARPRALEHDHAAGAGRPPIEITATPCRHGPPLQPADRRRRDRLRARAGRASSDGVVWISGDTVALRRRARGRRAGSTSAPRSSTSAACASRSPARSATR